MALFNEILVGRFNRAIQKLTGTKGQVPAPQLSAEIQPGFDIANLAVEDRFLLSVDRYAVQINPGAAAATFSAVRYRNPSGSNVIATIEKLSYGTSGAGVDSPHVQLKPGISADLTTVNPNTNTRLDSRSRPQPTLIVSSTTNFGALAGNSMWSPALLANTTVDMIINSNQEVVLGPGDVLDIIGAIANQSFLVSVFWRERFLEESERT